MDLNKRIVWLDLETTGLNPLTDRPVEVAVLITDPRLIEVARFETLIKLPTFLRDRLDPFIVDMHTKSGLLARLDAGEGLYAMEAEEQILSLFKACGVDRTSYLAGNSVGDFDRHFLRAHLPRVDKAISHRSINASTFKALFSLWAPEVKGPTPDADKPHRAMMDVEHSIRELKFWLDLLEPEFDSYGGGFPGYSEFRFEP